tara:strand:- start:1361 stop:2056 length:696 start_codon:yes stop_codon:yes gene_type:complete
MSNLNEEHSFIAQYLLPNNKLNHTKVWEELAKINGFQAEVNRGKQYHNIMEAYGRFKRDNPETAKDNVVMDTTRSGLHNSVHLDTNTQSVKIGIKEPMTEQTICDWLNQQARTKLELTGEQYSSYDAEEDRYIAEIKIRGKHYDNCLIEYDKFNVNSEHSARTGKDFLYIVAVKPNIYVFNVTHLNKKEWNYQWENRKMPKNTAFGGQDNKVDKKVGYVNVTQAKIVPCFL